MVVTATVDAVWPPGPGNVGRSKVMANEVAEAVPGASSLRTVTME
jgi:hypothetical protein